MKKEEIITREEFEMALIIVNKYHNQISEECKEVKKQVSNISKYSNLNENSTFYDADLPMGIFYYLKRDNVYLGIEKIDLNTKIKEISGMSITKFSHGRNVGKAKVKELKEMCYCAGVELSH